MKTDLEKRLNNLEILVANIARALMDKHYEGQLNLQEVVNCAVLYVEACETLDGFDADDARLMEKGDDCKHDWKFCGASDIKKCKLCGHCEPTR